MTQEKNTTTYTALEPIPFRPMGYILPYKGGEFRVFQLFVSKGEVEITSTSWGKPSTLKLPSDAQISFFGAAGIYEHGEHSMSIGDFSASFTYQPKTGKPIILVAKQFSSSTLDTYVTKQLAFNGILDTTVGNINLVHEAEIKKLIGLTNEPLFTPATHSLATTDIRVVSTFPNSLNDKEELAYSKLPTTITSVAILEPVNKFIQAVYVTIDPDQIHFSAAVKLFKVSGSLDEKVELLKEFDVSDQLPAEMFICNTEMWRQKKYEEENPQLIQARFSTTGNNLVFSHTWNNARFIMNTATLFEFSSGGHKLIPVQWIFGSYVNKASEKDRAVFNAKFKQAEKEATKK